MADGGLQEYAHKDREITCKAAKRTYQLRPSCITYEPLTGSNGVVSVSPSNRFNPHLPLDTVNLHVNSICSILPAVPSLANTVVCRSCCGPTAWLLAPANLTVGIHLRLMRRHLWPYLRAVSLCDPT